MGKKLWEKRETRINENNGTERKGKEKEECCQQKKVGKETGKGRRRV